LLLATNGIFRIFIRLDIDQSVDAILFDKFGAKAKSMLLKPIP